MHSTEVAQKDAQTLAMIVGVLSLIMGVMSILGGSPVPGGFFVLLGLAALGTMGAMRSGMAGDLGGDMDRMMSMAGLGAAGAVGMGWLGMSGIAFLRSRTGGEAGFADLHFWWGVIGTLLAIAALAALTGGFLHFRQQRD